MYGSKGLVPRNGYNTKLCSKCGLVKFEVMKLHIVLQALSSLQAHTDDLRIYKKIVILEQGKPGIRRLYRQRSSDEENYKV